jgi:hypothetical protein
MSERGNPNLKKVMPDRNFGQCNFFGPHHISLGEIAVAKLVYVILISAALATSPALAKGGLVPTRITNSKPHAMASGHAGRNAFLGRHLHGETFRNSGPIVIVVGGSYVDQHDAYCAQNFPRYDLASETYLGDDGRRYLCPDMPE